MSSAPRAPIVRSNGATQASAPSARSRAVRLVAEGDKQLVASRGEHQGLAAAATAYRNAAAAVKDDPDIHLRHAIALAALGRRREADAAVGRAAAIDGRLLAGHRIGGDPSAPSPAVARGMAILRDIASSGAEDGVSAEETVALLADRWAGRQAGPLATIATGEPPAR